MPFPQLATPTGALLAACLFTFAPGGAHAVTATKAKAQAAATGDAPALPAYQADLSQTTVSGLSSGAFMAAQFAVAYSSTVTGAGIIAGGPYFCSGQPGSFPYIPYLTNALGTCMNPDSAHVAPPVASELLRAANDFARARLIDDTANLKRQRVYLFSGTKDQTVTRPVVEQVGKFYELAGTPTAQIRFVDTVNAGHAIITDNNQDKACDVTASPFINDCDFVQARDILQHLYPDLLPSSTTLTGKLISFNQRSFIRNSYSSMNNTAYAYIPKACDSESCRVHVVFHGCLQTTQAIGNRFYTSTGYNQVADANKIIVLYPQAEPSPVFPYNPKGCWDFWGYTSLNPLDPNFYTRSGTQMDAVKRMLDRLGAARNSRQ
ncbi:extracellular catalytic domain type 2 short-chain-length polyhydroxyalkanoate depolymerase [Janthinobacterium sp. 1_2014MBL_MicDiv]|uniref:extracellular catalytic domain type 2 short-chain-length polyhydroxyalkanoate depolymerase n=1 Tax=Janthinobacterium sp. 1_2014MBL_MicDiv TaxID=1644131 RepID=UPI0008F54EC2|nr:poly(3-hydroxybutyrate) depolymerase [Janthinobacterium sp. 1_2014MBL_MicDiv]APA70740.1 poly (3-hydroxybutyrate) depolymerase [Janthinobacterium sp. 1_2014MBL_MicDiv]